MIQISPHRQVELDRALAEHRRLAEAACQAADLDEIKGHLNDAWHVRWRALDILNTAEAEAREAALARLEHAA